MKKAEMFREGQALWFEYVRVNGYSFNPNKQGLQKMSRLLDLKQTYIAKLINFYLEQ